jgi:dTDP-4-amino-4,6-dideoxygalactose transaminase
MNELQAAFGLLQLKQVEDNIKKRKSIAEYYKTKLADVDGIDFLKVPRDVKQNYSYFPILVDKKKYGKTRDELYEQLKNSNIFSRRYFYPLISNFSTYNSLFSAKKEHLIIANKIADEVLCLPIYPELEFELIKYITKIIKEYK